MITCQIEWIDSNGKPTPDQNEATCLVVCHTSGQPDRAFFCCEKHALQAHRMPNWSVRLINSETLSKFMLIQKP